MSLRRRRVAHADYDASGETAVMHGEQCSFPTAGGACLGDVWPIASVATNPEPPKTPPPPLGEVFDK